MKYQNNQDGIRKYMTGDMENTGYSKDDAFVRSTAGCPATLK